MRLATVQTDQGPRACALWDGQYVDLNAADGSLPASLREFLALGSEGRRRAETALQNGTVRYEPETVQYLRRCPTRRRSSAWA